MNRAIFASIALLAGLLLAGAPAIAENNGTTSGPAAGNNAKPNAAMSTQQHETGNGGAAVHPSVGAGAAGVTAKPNTESGPATKAPGDGQQK